MTRNFMFSTPFLEEQSTKIAKAFNATLEFSFDYLTYYIETEKGRLILTCYYRWADFELTNYGDAFFYDLLKHPFGKAKLTCFEGEVSNSVTNIPREWGLILFTGLSRLGGEDLYVKLISEKFELTAHEKMEAVLN